MLPSIVLFVFAFTLSILLVPSLRDLARRRGWVDQPDKLRKAHRQPTPRLGGLAIILAYAGSLSLAFAAFPGSPLVRSSFALFLTLAPASAIVFAVGIIDDFFNLKARHKLLCQTCAAVLACLTGIRIEHLGSSPLSSFVGVPLTIIWLLACGNGFNLIDGLDGLASGLALVASLTIATAGFLSHDLRLITAMLPLAGALLAFLIFNFNPASIFLGDCGSLWLGFVLGSYAVAWSQHATTVPGALAPFAAFCIPLLDTSLSIARRFLRRYPVLSGDRAHIHHRLIDRGLTQRQAVLVLVGIAAVFSGISLLQSAGGTAISNLAFALFGFLACYGIHCLDYKEFATAARVLCHSRFRSSVKMHLALGEHEESLRTAATFEQCWLAVCRISRELGFSYVLLRLNGQFLEEELASDMAPSWLLHISLSDSDCVQLRCKIATADTRIVFAPLVDLLYRTLSRKAGELGIERLRELPASGTDSRVVESARYVRSAAHGA